MAGYSLKSLCSNLLPNGKYKVQITDIKFAVNAAGESSSNIAVVYTIVDGPYAKRNFSNTISDKTFSWRLTPFLTACKVDVNRELPSKEEMFRYMFKECKGKVMFLEIETRTYNGKEYNDIKTWIPLPESKTTAEEVELTLGGDAEVKGNSLDGMVEEETTAPSVDEPQLDINLDVDMEAPF